jgi:hypothetical protein
MGNGVYGFSQQDSARDILPMGIGRWKMGADIPTGTCSQQRIDNSVNEHITVGMTGLAFSGRYDNPSDNQVSFFYQPVYVISGTNPYQVR